MKRFGLQILAGILILSNSYSQTYYPLPESNTYWRYTENDVPIICGCWGICSEEQYKITGDTLINSIVYHKIEHSGYWLDDNCDEGFYTYGYRGAFRNDIENKKVWFVPVGEASEGLLYEFDLEIGDTLLPGILNPSNYWDFWVEDIDSVEVGDSYRKLFLIRSQLNLGEMPLRIIEGIGGQNLIAPMEYWLNFEVGYMFKCINMNDSIIYPEWGDCELIVSDKTIDPIEKFEIFPNPSSGKFWIQNPYEYSQPMSVTVYNSYGVRVRHINSEETITIVDLSEFPRGIYLVQGTFGMTIIKEKIIIK